MQLDRHGKLIRWAYLWEQHGPPSRTSLCAVFWLSVLVTPVKLLTVTTFLASLIAVLFGVIPYWIVTVFVWYPLLMVPLALSAVALVAYDIATHDRRADDESYIDRAMERLVEAPLVQGALAVKRGICPIVEIR